MQFLSRDEGEWGPVRSVDACPMPVLMAVIFRSVCVSSSFQQATPESG